MSVSVIFQVLLQIAGLSMIGLAFAHFALEKVLNWRTDLQHLTPINARVFMVHTVFLAVGILILGIVCLAFPSALITRTPLGAIAAISFALCWLSRLLCQLFIFTTSITGNAKLDRGLNVAGTMLWLFYCALFATLFFYQIGEISDRKF